MGIHEAYMKCGLWSSLIVTVLFGFYITYCIHVSHIKGYLGGGILGIHEAYMKCGLWSSLIVTVLFGFYITYCIHVSHIKGCLGGGILGIHEAYMKCGLWSSLIVTVVFGFYITYCIHVSHIKGCPSGGNMGIHEAYMKCGLWSSLIVTVVFGFYITYCIHLLVKSAQVLYKRLHLPVMSYPDVAEASMEVGPFPRLRKYSKWFRYAVDIIICIDLFGACCVYQIIIAKTIKQLVQDEGAADMTSEDLPHLRLYILALLVPVLLLCMIRTLKYLAPFTLVADLFIGMSVVVSFLILVGFFGYWGYGENSRSPLGAFCLSNIGFVFPAIIELLVVWEDPGLGRFKWRLWKNILVMIVGVL
ncbi:putative proton-coupled amino acid transporter, partial [Operophtera brumata]